MKRCLRLHFVDIRAL